LALSALRGDIRGEKFLAALEYRFANGDFAGHTLRNALLTALELTSDLDAAIATMARVLQVPTFAGVIPTTLKPLTQQVEVRQGATWEIIGTGEHAIAHKLDIQTAAPDMADVKVTFAEKGVQLNPRAAQALEQATHILVAPGHTYGTILPTLASLHLAGLPQEIPAKVIVVMTLLTTPHQTTGFSGEDFVKLYEMYLPRRADVVIANNGEADVSLVAGQDWVKFTAEKHDYELIQEPLVAAEKQKQTKEDVVPRSIVIHEPEKLRAVLSKVLS
jgi:uncharacterized cofD-like protein